MGQQSVKLTAPWYSDGKLVLSGNWNTGFTAQSTNTPAVVDAWGQGRAVYVAGSNYGSFQMNNLALRGGSSSANPGGGGLYTELPTTLTDATVDSSKSTGNGGGIYATKDLTLTRSVVSNNESVGHLGGGLIALGALSVTDSTVAGNKADQGGGIYNNAGSSISLSGVTVSGNTASGSFGGGVVVAKPTTIDNCTISGNSAPAGTGGGLYLSTAAVTIRNTTITDNQAPSGAGLAVSGSATTITSSIIAGNRTNTGAYDADVSDNGNKVTSGGGNIVGRGNIDRFTVDFDQRGITDPGLGTLQDAGGPAQGGTAVRIKTHAPSAASLAVDAGICGSTAQDQRSEVRPGTGSSYCDAGAVELQSVTANCFSTNNFASTERSSVNGRAFQAALDEATERVNVGGVCKGMWFKAGTVQTALINKSLTIVGGTPSTYKSATPAGRAVIDAGGLGRVLLLDNTASISVTASNLELVNGHLGDDGAGLLNRIATLTLNNAYIHDNVADTASGGGIANRATMTVNASRVEANRGHYGGGIFDGSGNSLAIKNTTVSGNAADICGGGIYAAGTGLDLQSVTLSGNNSQSGGGLCTSSAGKLP